MKRLKKNYDKKKYNKAFKLFMKCAEQDDKEAMWYVGNCYCYGNGVEQNYEKALEWYTRAIEKGNKTAFYDIAMLYDTLEDFENAKEYFNKVVQSGEFPEDMIEEAKEKLASY